MVKTICDCCAIENEKVQLQIVKAILTLGTSPHCEVHGNSLLICLRACYNIFLSTKNIDVQTSAKAVLTQIVCAVFQKMEKTQQLSTRKQQAKHQHTENHLMCRSLVIGLTNEVVMKQKYDVILPYQSSSDSSARGSKSRSPQPTNPVDPQSPSHPSNDNEEEQKESLNSNEEKGNDPESVKSPKESKADKAQSSQSPQSPSRSVSRSKSKSQSPSNNSRKKPKSPKSLKSESQSKNLSAASPEKLNLNSIKCGKFGWCSLCGAPAGHYCIQVLTHLIT